MSSSPTRRWLTAEEAEKLKQQKLRRQRKLRAKREAERKAKEAEEEEKRRIQEEQDRRWRECLQCLKDSVPQLRKNPWLIVQEPTFIHNYLDSLTDTISNLSKYKSDLEKVRVVLQDVYEGFVDLGKFAKHQPAFFISSPATIKRFVRLLEQVAHKGSDKALFPNVLSLLSPTFERPELYDILADARITYSLMSFARNDWLPTPLTLVLLLQIFEQISRSPRLRQMLADDAGYEKLMALAYGTAEGFSKEQQAAAQQALASMPVPDAITEALAEAAASASSDDLSAGPASVAAAVAAAAAAAAASASAPAATPRETVGTGIAASMTQGRVGHGAHLMAAASGTPRESKVAAPQPEERKEEKGAGEEEETGAAPEEEKDATGVEEAGEAEEAEAPAA